MTRTAECPFCSRTFPVRFSRHDGQYAYPRHLDAGTPCPGSFAFVPPGAFTDKEPAS